MFFLFQICSESDPYEVQHPLPLFIFFLSFLKGHCESELFGFYKRKKKKDAEVQCGKRLGRKEYYLRMVCSLQSSFLDSVLVLLALFQNEPCSLLSCLGLLLFFFALKEVFNQNKSGFNIHVFGKYLLNRSNVPFKVLWWILICLLVFKVTHLFYSPNSCNLGHLVISNSALKAGILVRIKWTGKKKDLYSNLPFFTVQNF